MTTDASRVICKAKFRASRSPLDQRPAFKSASSASETPARRRSASAVTRAYSQWLASAATHRILPQSEGPSGLFVRCRRSRLSIAAVVRGRSREVARAQVGRRDPPPASVADRSFQVSSFESSGQGFGESGAAVAGPAIVAARMNKDGHASQFMEKTSTGESGTLPVSFEIVGLLFASLLRCRLW